MHSCQLQTQINPENSTLSVISHTQNGKYCTIPFTRSPATEQQECTLSKSHAVVSPPCERLRESSHTLDHAGRSREEACRFNQETERETQEAANTARCFAMNTSNKQKEYALKQ